MTGDLIATGHWTRLWDGGTDICRFDRLDLGWCLSGDISAPDCALQYSVTCTPDWHTVSAAVSGRLGRVDTDWRVTRGSEGWSLNDDPVGLGDCIDIDLAITPATNLLPIRRLNLAINSQVRCRAAWFRPENGGSLTGLDQTYGRRDAHGYTYASPGFSADLTVHPSGLITRYGDLWTGPVQHG